MKLLAATSNKGKLAEIRALLHGSGVMVVSPEQVGMALDVLEDGTTFLENALKKARAWNKATGLAALADDSGLEVEALGGMPGVHSARYAGPDADDGKNFRKLLAELQDVPATRRGAAFRCAMALVASDGREWTSEGTLGGRIIFSPRGREGFGYDPVFELAQSGLTLAETPMAAKNALSHRGQALSAMLPRILELALLEPDERQEYNP